LSRPDGLGTAPAIEQVDTAALGGTLLEVDEVGRISLGIDQRQEY
jgi:hypothetical protein